MRVHVRAEAAGALLLCGVPFGQGEVAQGAALQVRQPGGEVLPLWWQARARWPDGSLKWAFLHVRLSDAESVLEVGSAAGMPPVLALGADGLPALAGVRLALAEHGFCFTAAGSGVRVRFGRALTEPAQPAGDGYAVEVVEPSPLAPLVRLRQQGAGGLLLDQLVRLDPEAGTLCWQQRLVFGGPRACRLRELTCELDFGEEAWTWEGAEGPHRRLLVLRPGAFSLDGCEQAGHPQARLRGQRAVVHLEKGWQRAPFALCAEGGRVRLELYPAEAEPLVVQPGTSLRHAVRLGLAGRTGREAQWWLDPEQACATGVFGPLVARTPATRRLFPGYEQAMEACLHAGRLRRLDKEPGQTPGPPAPLEEEAQQDEEYFGLQHYGDWPMPLGSYGGRRRMYADNEYDTPFAYFLQFVRTGVLAYQRVAYWSAVHMADVDCLTPGGDMRFHGYYDTAEDHAAHRSPGGELGHYWTDGLVLNWLLCDDWWSWEAATAQARYLLEVFAGEGDEPVRRHFLGCERAVGWPLVALAGVAEVSGDPDLLQKMAQMAGFLARFTADPDRQLEGIGSVGGRPIQWWRVCQEDGSKPFMLGVVLEGLERYHRLTGDPAASQATVDLCRFLTQVMWVGGVEAFVYEWNAFNRQHREDNYPHYINMMVAPGLAYAYELTGEEVFRQVATRAFHAALWTLFAPGGGKEIGMVGRTSALVVGRLYQWHQQDLARRAAALRPSVGVRFSFVGPAQSLGESSHLRLHAGEPRYRGGALLSVGASYAVWAFRDPVGTDRGDLGLTVTPDWDCPPQPGPVAQRAYVHLCGRPFTCSCVSIISFYTGLHVRFHDAHRHYIEVLETSVQDWRVGQPHRLRVWWDAGPGEAVLWVDGKERDRRRLGRRLSGAFAYLHLGHRPGNWRADGTLTNLELELG
ncbi:MAG: hypothetical protein AB1505_03600 [Candidatus Latescibacterota bacterium]